MSRHDPTLPWPCVRQGAACQPPSRVSGRALSVVASWQRWASSASSRSLWRSSRLPVGRAGLRRSPAPARPLLHPHARAAEGRLQARKRQSTSRPRLRKIQPLPEGLGGRNESTRMDPELLDSCGTASSRGIRPARHDPTSSRPIARRPPPHAAARARAESPGRASTWFGRAVDFFIEGVNSAEVRRRRRAPAGRRRRASTRAAAARSCTSTRGACRGLAAPVPLGAHPPLPGRHDAAHPSSDGRAVANCTRAPSRSESKGHVAKGLSGAARPPRVRVRRTGRRQPSAAAINAGPGIRAPRQQRRRPRPERAPIRARTTAARDDARLARADRLRSGRHGDRTGDRGEHPQASSSLPKRVRWGADRSLRAGR